jgi:hypothetical protein
MKEIKYICDACGGRGTNDKWVIDDDPNVEGFGIAHLVEKQECEACGGKGYTEYAVFEIEEAKQILKFCGLTTEF